MSEHTASVRWARNDQPFEPDTWPRDHRWLFDGGQELTGSASPQYQGSTFGVDPEEALIVALSSCHMLTALAIAAKKGIVIDSYEDDAVGSLGKNDDGRLALTQVTLRPRIVFAPGQAVDAEALARLHESAHKHCFIANSVKTEVVVEPR